MRVLGRRRIGLIGAACTAALGCMGGVAQAASCSYTWTGTAGNGLWNDAGNWNPAGVPGTDSNHATDSVCITAPGTYTVTLAPFADNGVGYPGGVQIGSLTLGGGANGTQTLLIDGQASVDRNNETTNQVDLDLASGASQIAANGELILDGTTAGTGAAGNGPDGGGAWLTEENNVSLVNAGTILSESNTSSLPTGDQWSNYLNGPSIVNDGHLEIQSGTLEIPSPNNSGYGYTNSTTVSNAGTFTVDSGGTYDLASGATFDNAATFANNGSTQMFGGSTWNQGSTNGMSGNLVQVQGGGQVDDSSPSAGQAQGSVATGSGGFEYVVSGGYLAGTIPAGQNVDVQGTEWNNAGNQSNDTTLTLGGPSNTYPGTVTNHGTVRLDADGTGTSVGGNANLTGNELDNDGTFETTVEDANFAAKLFAPLVNESGATAEVMSGTLYQGNNPTTNDGTASIAPGANWIVQSGSFTNNGTFAPQIASASNLGTMTLEGSLSGPGTFNAGGTIAPTLEAGYTPASGTEFQVIPLNGGAFKGTFGSVTGGFAADYGKESASPAYVGVTFGSTSTGTPPPAAGRLTLGHLTNGVGQADLKLACPAGTSGCAPFTVTATVTEKLRDGRVIAVAARAGKPKVTAKVVVVATARGGTLAAGASGGYVLKLNSAGKALLKHRKHLTARVTVMSGSTAVASGTVTFTAPTPAKRTKKH
jgi:hypothetical protein